MTVPEGWKSYKLEEHSEVIVSPVDKKSHPDEQSVLLCNYMDVYNNERITPDIDFMEATATSREIEKFTLRKGDVLITKDSETPDDIARPAYVAESLENLLCGYHLAILRSDQTILDGAFLANQLASHSSRCHFSSRASGATRFGLTVKSICDTPVLLPPLPEQKKIAAILSSVDETIQAARETIEQTKRVKQGLVQELLTRGIGHTRFKKTEIGEIPEEWDLGTLGSVAKVQGGFAFSSKDSATDGARWLKIANVSIGKVVWNATSYLPESFLDIHTDFVLHPGDIIAAMTRPVLQRELKIAELNSSDAPALLNQRVCRFLIPEGSILPRFLFTVMQSVRVADYIEKVISGSDPPNVSSRQLESIPIQIPSMAEQVKIAGAFSSVDSRLHCEQSSLEQLKSLKKGLMEDLLTGKVRVC